MVDWVFDARLSVAGNFIKAELFALTNLVTDALRYSGTLQRAAPGATVGVPFLVENAPGEGFCQLSVGDPFKASRHHDKTFVLLLGNILYCKVNLQTLSNTFLIHICQNSILCILI